MSDNDLERAICEEALSGKYRHYGASSPHYIGDSIELPDGALNNRIKAEPRWMRRENKKRPTAPKYFHGKCYANNFNFYGVNK